MKLTPSGETGYLFKHQAILPTLIISEQNTKMKISSLKHFLYYCVYNGSL